MMETKNYLLGMELCVQKSFKLENGQKGVLAFIGGEVAGLDFVSREQAFAVLHAKLVKSYAIEAMLVGERGKAVSAGKAEKGEKKGDTGKPLRKRGKAGEQKPDEARAREFLGRAAECKETRYESVGLGSSLRYEGRSVIGSVLAVDDRVIHMAFFRSSESEGERVGDMAAFSSGGGSGRSEII
jgi:hypothetical protein